MSESGMDKATRKRLEKQRKKEAKAAEKALKAQVKAEKKAAKAARKEAQRAAKQAARRERYQQRHGRQGGGEGNTHEVHVDEQGRRAFAPNSPNQQALEGFRTQSVALLQQLQMQQASRVGEGGVVEGVARRILELETLELRLVSYLVGGNADPAEFGMEEGSEALLGAKKIYAAMRGLGLGELDGILRVEAGSDESIPVALPVGPSHGSGVGVSVDETTFRETFVHAIPEVLLDVQEYALVTQDHFQAMTPEEYLWLPAMGVIHVATLNPEIADGFPVTSGSVVRVGNCPKVFVDTVFPAFLKLKSRLTKFLASGGTTLELYQVVMAKKTPASKTVAVLMADLDPVVRGIVDMAHFREFVGEMFNIYKAFTHVDFDCAFASVSHVDIDLAVDGIDLDALPARNPYATSLSSSDSGDLKRPPASSFSLRDPVNFDSDSSDLTNDDVFASQDDENSSASDSSSSSSSSSS